MLVYFRTERSGEKHLLRAHLPSIGVGDTLVHGGRGYRVTKAIVAGETASDEKLVATVRPSIIDGEPTFDFDRSEELAEM